MDALVLSTLLFNTIGTAVIVLGAALASFLPGRRRPRRWASTGTDAAAPPADVPGVVQPPVEVELPHAA